MKIKKFVYAPEDHWRYGRGIMKATLVLSIDGMEYGAELLVNEEVPFKIVKEQLIHSISREVTNNIQALI